MNDLSTMTAAELVERLATCNRVSLHHLSPGEPYHTVSSEPFRVVWHQAEGDSWLVCVNRTGSCYGNHYGHAPTLAGALGEAMRKAEGNE